LPSKFKAAPDCAFEVLDEKLQNNIEHKIGINNFLLNLLIGRLSTFLALRHKRGITCILAVLAIRDN
jgi:hypothetical protein